MDTDPEIYLRGENLEYFRNIEYLKEMTRQATALISRSNAMYNNILMDDHIGVKARGLSISDDNRSISPDYGRCAQCGLVHGCGAFCIVGQIMAEEEIKEQEPEESMSVKVSTTKAPTVGRKGKTKRPISPEQPFRQPTWKSLKIEGKMSPEKALETYEMLCARYGPAIGQRFLQARVFIDEPKPMIEPWTTTGGRQNWMKPPNEKYREIERKCARQIEETQYLCPDWSPEICQKTEKLVGLLPPCEGVPYKPEKRWRDILKQPVKIKRRLNQTVIQVEHDSEHDEEEEEEPTQCACGIPDCFCGKMAKCDIKPIKKVCHTDFDSTNNYLVTVRRKLERRRATKTRRFTEAVSKTNSGISHRQSTPLVNHYIKMARGKQLNSLCQCLNEFIPENFNQEDLHSFYDKVTSVAETTRLTTLNDQEWDLWQQNYKKLNAQELGEDGDGDSLGSDMSTDWSDLSILTNSWDIDYRSGKKVFPTRIPYAQEVYDKLENLFERISAKFLKTTKKNHFKKELSKLRLSCEDQYASMATGASHNSAVKEILSIMKVDEMYTKVFRPFHVRKRTKLKRLQDWQKRDQRAQTRRDMIGGIQFGKMYRPKSKFHKYSAEGGFTGFNRPARQLLLAMPESQRFSTCDLVGDGSDALTKEKIQHDYRLLCKLFDKPKECSRETMMDEEMRSRLEKYQKTVRRYREVVTEPSEKEQTESSDSEDNITYAVPKKEEARLVQASMNGPQKERIGSAKSGKSRAMQQTTEVSAPTGKFFGAPIRSSKCDASVQKGFSCSGNSKRTSTAENPGKRDSQSKCSKWLESSSMESPREYLKGLTCTQQNLFSPEPTNRGKVTATATIGHGRSPHSKNRKVGTETSSVGTPGSISLPGGASPRRLVNERKSHGQNLGDYKEILQRYQELTLPLPPLSELSEEISQSYLSDLGNRRPLKEEGRVVKSSRDDQILGSSTVPESSGRSRDSRAPSASARTSRDPSKPQTFMQGADGLNQVKPKQEAPKKPPTQAGSSQNLQQDNRQPGKLGAQEMASNSNRDVGLNRSLSLKNTAIPASSSRSQLNNSQSGAGSSGIPSLQGSMRSSQPNSSKFQDNPESQRASLHSRATPEQNLPTLKVEVSQSSSISKNKQFHDSEPLANYDTQTAVPRSDHSPPSSARPSVQRDHPPSQKSDVFSTSESTNDKVTKTRQNKPKIRVQDRQASKSIISLKTIPDLEKMRAEKALDMLGPTKKRSFGVDIGQGISYVQYLRANAVDADAQKQDELVNLMCVPRKKKKAPPFVPKSQESSDSQLQTSASSGSSRQGRLFSELGNEEKKTQKVAKAISVDSDGGHPYKFTFKTLDEIYKEVHGINVRNTPKELIENDYEHEALKKQQLRKHRLE